VRAILSEIQKGAREASRPPTRAAKRAALGDGSLPERREAIEGLQMVIKESARRPPDRGQHAPADHRVEQM